MMLAHLGETTAARSIEKAVADVIAKGEILTKDLGGTASTETFTQAVIDALKR